MLSMYCTLVVMCFSSKIQRNNAQKPRGIPVIITFYSYLQLLGLFPKPHRGIAPGPCWGTSAPDPLLAHYSPLRPYCILDKSLYYSTVFTTGEYAA